MAKAPGIAMAAEPRRTARARFGLTDKFARKLVQVGFLGLFLYPIVPVVYRRLTFKPAPTLTSWLLPWDPLLLLGQVAHRNWPTVVVGAPLLLLALTLLMGRSFCGWVCPLGTVLDLVRSLAFWQRRRARPVRRLRRNSWARYYVLVAVAVGAAVSLQVLGVLDPLVVFQRAATTLMADFFSLRQPELRIYLAAVSFVFVAMLALELWQPRFWCRNLCPLGALLSLGSRYSLLNRRVDERCDGCGECARACPMRAIPREAHDTDYSDCSFCLDCAAACPKGAISFGFGALAGRRWQRLGHSLKAAGKRVIPGRYVSAPAVWPSRRQVAGGIAAGVTGLALAPLLDLAGHEAVIRPPGALSEREFVRACIICQECVRACPTGGLKPTLFGAGLAGIGTPQLVPRQGGCSLSSNCPQICAQVCPVGAIRPVSPSGWKIGLAEVNHHLCLAWDQGVKCLVCVEACVVGAAQVYHGRVTIDPNKCTGCGRCEGACPVAGSAIHVKPLAHA